MPIKTCRGVNFIPKRKYFRVIPTKQKFLSEYADQILVVSSGFKDFILPITEFLGLKSENVYANTFVYNEQGDIIGIDNENVLANTGGKIKLVKSLNFDAHVSVIGDGFTDYEIKKAA